MDDEARRWLISLDPQIILLGKTPDDASAGLDQVLSGEKVAKEEVFKRLDDTLW